MFQHAEAVITIVSMMEIMVPTVPWTAPQVDAIGLGALKVASFQNGTNE